jgi:hypothetical protein
MFETELSVQANFVLFYGYNMQWSNRLSVEFFDLEMIRALRMIDRSNLRRDTEGLCCVTGRHDFRQPAL